MKEVPRGPEGAGDLPGSEEEATLSPKEADSARETTNTKQNITALKRNIVIETYRKKQNFSKCPNDFRL